MPPPRRLLIALAVLAGGVLTSSCRDAEAPPSIDASVSPLCQAGCQEQDPDPSAPGVFLGSGVTPLMCGPHNPNGINDSDNDGLSDFCELQVARAFAPELAYYSRDNVGREPHWAARPIAAGGVRIAYLLSYYVDLGTQGYPCCDDWHNGDSEGIYLDVTYEFDTQHWVLETAYYSAHTGYNVYGPGASGYPASLHYPAHQGSYPRTYVSGYKHANYDTFDDCMDGGTFGSDWCTPDSFARVVVGTYANVGSSGTHLLDCVPSTNRFYQNNGDECYWSGARFDGWQNVLPDADPYGPKLAYWGF